MFVASYARLPPGSRFHLSVNVQIFPCNALYRVFAVTIWVGSDRLLQCAYHLGATSLRLGPFIIMRGTASVPLGPSITMRGTASLQWTRFSGMVTTTPNVLVGQLLVVCWFG